MSVEANAWTTLAAVKRHLKIDTLDTDHDAELEALINAAYLMLEGYIHHPLKAADYTEYYDGDGTNSVVLRKYPINSIASVHDDPDRVFGSDTLIPSTDYLIDNDDQVGSLRLFLNTLSFSEAIKNVKVVYNAGYTTIPADAERACILLVDYLFNRAGSVGLTSQSMGGKSESYSDEALPPFIRQLVMRFKEFSV